MTSDREWLGWFILVTAVIFAVNFPAVFILLIACLLVVALIQSSRA